MVGALMNESAVLCNAPSVLAPPPRGCPCNRADVEVDPSRRRECSLPTQLIKKHRCNLACFMPSCWWSAPWRASPSRSTTERRQRSQLSLVLVHHGSEAGLVSPITVPVPDWYQPVFNRVPAPKLTLRPEEDGCFSLQASATRLTSHPHWTGSPLVRVPQRFHSGFHTLHKHSRLLHGIAYDTMVPARPRADDRRDAAHGHGPSTGANAACS
jgi:hypothetical protein